MDTDIPIMYSYYNFEIKQLDPNIEESFCITYKDKEIASYAGTDSVYDIDKAQIRFKLDNYLPMDFLHFSIDFIYFRTNMSILFYKYTYETKQIFFFNYSVFEEYCSQIKELIVDEINDLKKKLPYENLEPEINIFDSFEVIVQKILSLIDILYNHQKNYSSNTVLNSKIHTIVAFYPNFGLYFDILKNELKAFDENNHYLTLTKKYSIRDLACFFKNLNPILHEKALENLFNVKNIRQAYENIRYKEKKPDKITEDLRKYI